MFSFIIIANVVKTSGEVEELSSPPVFTTKKRRFAINSSCLALSPSPKDSHLLSEKPKADESPSELEVARFS